MRWISLFVVFSMAGLAACGDHAARQAAALPAACELAPVATIQDILRESVKNPTPANAGVGELSACTYTLPARSLDDYLGIYVLPPRSPRDAVQLQALAEEWKERNAGAAYQLLSDAEHPEAWFPGEYKVYPSTFIILFDKASLVITGVALDDARAIAFQAMVQHQWQ